MKKEDKELLLKDLCARLPYSVKGLVTFNRTSISKIQEDRIIDGKLYDRFAKFQDLWYDNVTIKPYLFPISSMTEKQREEYESLCIKETSECADLSGFFFTKDYYYDTVESIDYLYKNHIDIRGLIPMGLANDATGLNIY